MRQTCCVCLTYPGPSEWPLWASGVRRGPGTDAHATCSAGVKSFASDPGIACLPPAPRPQDQANLSVRKKGKILDPSRFPTVHQVTFFSNSASEGTVLAAGLALPGCVLMAASSHRDTGAPGHW